MKRFKNKFRKDSGGGSGSIGGGSSHGGDGGPTYDPYAVHDAFDIGGGGALDKIYDDLDAPPAFLKGGAASKQTKKKPWELISEQHPDDDDFSQIYNNDANDISNRYLVSSTKNDDEEDVYGGPPSQPDSSQALNGNDDSEDDQDEKKDDYINHNNGRMSLAHVPTAASSFSLYDDISVFAKDFDDHDDGGDGDASPTMTVGSKSYKSADGPLMRRMMSNRPQAGSSEAPPMRGRLNSQESCTFSLYDDISCFAKDVDDHDGPTNGAAKMSESALKAGIDRQSKPSTTSNNKNGLMSKMYMENPYKTGGGNALPSPREDDEEEEEEEQPPLAQNVRVVSTTKPIENPTNETSKFTYDDKHSDNQSLSSHDSHRRDRRRGRSRSHSRSRSRSHSRNASPQEGPSHRGRLNSRYYSSCSEDESRSRGRSRSRSFDSRSFSSRSRSRSLSNDSRHNHPRRTRSPSPPQAAPPPPDFSDEDEPTPEINRGSDRRLNGSGRLEIPSNNTSRHGRQPSYGSMPEPDHRKTSSRDSFGSFGSFGDNNHMNDDQLSRKSNHSTKSNSQNHPPPILMASSTMSSDSGSKENALPSMTRTDSSTPSLSKPYAPSNKRQSFDSLAGYSVSSQQTTDSKQSTRSSNSRIAPLKAPPSSSSLRSSQSSNTTGGTPSRSSSRSSSSLASPSPARSFASSTTTQRHSNNSNTLGGRSSSTSSSAGPPRNPSVDAMNRRLHSEAKMHLRRNELDLALTKFEEILESQRRQYGPQHKLVGAALHNVAIVHFKSGRNERALKTCQEAVLVRKQSQGSKHSDVAQSLLKLGSIHLALNQPDDAMQAYKEALAIRNHLYQLQLYNDGIVPGQDDFDGDESSTTTTLSRGAYQGLMNVAHAMAQIGLLYFSLGELMAAVTTFDDVLKIYRKLVRQKDSKGGSELNTLLAETLSHVGTIRTKRTQYDKAIVALEEAMMLQTLELGDDSSVVLTTMDNLAYCYSKYKSQDNAIDLYGQMLAKQEGLVSKYKSSNKSSQVKYYEMECVKTLGKLSIVYEKLSNFSKAMECTSAQLQRQRQYLDYNHPELEATKRTFARLEKKIRMADC